MNTNFSESNLIFLDQHLSKNNDASARRSSLREACREQSDAMEVWLRVFLVLCMLTALLIGGWHASTLQRADINTPQPVLAAQGFSVNGQHTF